MNADFLGPLALLVTALLTPLIQWLLARRRHTGKIGTTDAERLWTEASELRKAYAEEAQKMRVEAVALRAEIATLRAEVAELRAALAAERRRRRVR